MTDCFSLRHILRTQTAGSTILNARLLPVLACCMLAFLLQARGQPSYVRVEGTHLALDGKPYYFLGSNFWYGFYLGSPGQTGQHDRLLRELDRMKAIGIDNLRILGGSELSQLINSVTPAIQTSPGVYDDSLLAGLDLLLSEMAKREMHAVVVLNNFWEWSGGMAQYHSWFGGGPVKDPAVEGYAAFVNYSAAFYRNPEANAGFRRFISDLVRRRNTVTGVSYYEDPVIMAWELANEPRPGMDATYVQAYNAWMDSTAGYIHSLDPNHLVTTGHEGTAGCLGSEQIFLDAHQSPFIDYVTIHIWAYYWGWFNPYDIPGTYPAALSKAKSYFRQHLALAHELHKPLVLEEFGLTRDSMRFAEGTPTLARNDYYKELLSLVYDSARAGTAVAGSNFWGWGGEARCTRSDFRWRAGDPFMCDPPMERQGINSVYDTDSATHSVLADHASLMVDLRESTRVEPGVIPWAFRLEQNYPNPFNASTVIRLHVPLGSQVDLRVFDVWGREVRVLLDGWKEAGVHVVRFSGENLATGTYFCRLMAPTAVQTTKMILLH